MVLKGRTAAATKAPEGAIWCPVDNFVDQAFPTVMKKVAELALLNG